MDFLERHGFSFLELLGLTVTLPPTWVREVQVVLSSIEIQPESVGSCCYSQHGHNKQPVADPRRKYREALRTLQLYVADKRLDGTAEPTESTDEDRPPDRTKKSKGMWAVALHGAARDVSYVECQVNKFWSHRVNAASGPLMGFGFGAGAVSAFSNT